MIKLDIVVLSLHEFDIEFSKHFRCNSQAWTTVYDAASKSFRSYRNAKVFFVPQISRLAYNMSLVLSCIYTKRIKGVACALKRR